MAKCNCALCTIMGLPDMCVQPSECTKMRDCVNRMPGHTVHFTDPIFLSGEQLDGLVNDLRNINEGATEILNGGKMRHISEREINTRPLGRAIIDFTDTHESVMVDGRRLVIARPGERPVTLNLALEFKPNGRY